MKQDYWKYPSGPLNTIADVPGVTVGHKTLTDGAIQTGVTAIKVHAGNHFQQKVPAATHVINGFGKSVGLVQIEELGELETPIILTNTLSVGTAMTGLIKYMLKDNPDIGLTTGTVNAVVCECNDGYLNDIRGLHVQENDVEDALNDCKVVFERGAVGAGRGMSCYELKGGIGSASRQLVIDDQEFTVGITVLTNFGRLSDLRLKGESVGEKMQSKSEHQDKGSIIVILATNIPLDSRQLKRVIKRTAVGIARTGSYIGNGSGEIAVGFSTASHLSHTTEKAIVIREVLHENHLDAIFAVTAEATEAAILDSLYQATDVKGRDGNSRMSLTTITNL